MSYIGNLMFENPRIKYDNIVMQMNKSKKKETSYLWFLFPNVLKTAPYQFSWWVFRSDSLFGLDKLRTI